MVQTPTKRVIDLNPHEIGDETLAALKAEVQQQADTELDTIEMLPTFVLSGDDGLNSHAVAFTLPDDTDS